MAGPAGGQTKAKAACWPGPVALRLLQCLSTLTVQTRSEDRGQGTGSGPLGFASELLCRRWGLSSGSQGMLTAQAWASGVGTMFRKRAGWGEVLMSDCGRLQCELQKLPPPLLPPLLCPFLGHLETERHCTAYFQGVGLLTGLERGLCCSEVSSNRLCSSLYPSHPYPSIHPPSLCLSHPSRLFTVPD